ncbi:MAG: hypothetical protein GF400_06295 [Candidatus Eisenbacteria bacterium]|nr:hypothetical protein [Candidatus Eisenbacteria bacterium]
MSTRRLTYPRSPAATSTGTPVTTTAARSPTRRAWTGTSPRIRSSATWGWRTTGCTTRRRVCPAATDVAYRWERTVRVANRRWRRRGGGLSRRSSVSRYRPRPALQATVGLGSTPAGHYQHVDKPYSRAAPAAQSGKEHQLATTTAVYFLSVCVAVALSGAAAAETIEVPGEEATIADGIGAASAGDTVLIACNTYYESALYVAEPITIAGATGDAGCVVIDGGGSSQILHVSQASGAVIQGITFTNGYSFLGGAVLCDTSSVTFESCAFTGNYSGYIAGAVFVENEERSTQTFDDCVFSDNYSEGAAGAVWVEYGTASFTACTFDGNEAEWGGGAVSTQDSTTVGFTDCVFDGNTTSDGWGGALETDEGCVVTLSACAFTGNEVSEEGGAVYASYGLSFDIVDCDFIGNSAPTGLCGGVSLDEMAQISVTDSRFESNTSDGDGAALYIDESTNVTFERNEFVGNTGDGGGVVSIYGTPMTFTDCLFAGNTGSWGGALEIWNSDPTTVHGCTFTGNEMLDAYGGPAITIYGTYEDPTVTIECCSISDNTGGEPVYASDGFANCSCTIVWGNPSGDWVGPIAGQETSNGNLCEDPLFCDPEGGDYMLCADSPCLPDNNDCGMLIGPYVQGCPPCGSPVEASSWGAIKARFR